MLESWKIITRSETSLFCPTRRSDGIRAAGLHCGLIVKRVTVESTDGQSACARWQRTAWAEIGQKVLTPARLRLYLYVNRIICCECGSVTTFKLNHDTHSFSVYMYVCSHGAERRLRAVRPLTFFEFLLARWFSFVALFSLTLRLVCLAISWRRTLITY